MKLQEEKKLVTIEVTAQEMDEINTSGFANIGSDDTIVDLETYHNCKDEDVEVLQIVIRKLSESNIEADLVQFYQG